MKEWLESEIQGEHLLCPAREDIPVFDDRPIYAVIDHYWKCPRKIKRLQRRLILEILIDWRQGKSFLVPSPDLRNLFNLIRELKIYEAKPYIQQILLESEPNHWQEDTVYLCIFHAAAALTTSEDVGYWKVVAEHYPHYRVFIFPILKSISYEDALELAQTIDYESIFNIEYLEREAPNFRDFIIDREKRPPDLVCM